MISWLEGVLAVSESTPSKIETDIRNNNRVVEPRGEKLMNSPPSIPCTVQVNIRNELLLKRNCIAVARVFAQVMGF